MVDQTRRSDGRSRDDFVAPQWIPRYFLQPGDYVATGDHWERFDLRAWTADEYSYRPDGWDGLRNVPQSPAETVRSGTGDCEDYALVALSWLRAQGYEDVGMAVYYYGENSYGHALAYGPDRVYSSGAIIETSPREFFADSSFAVMLTNELTD